MEIEKETKIIMWYLLVRLKNMRKWGASHSELKRVVKSLPSQLSTTSKHKKQIEKAIKNLLNFGFITIYKKTGEDHTSLNPRKATEINNFIKETKETMFKNNYIK